MEIIAIASSTSKLRRGMTTAIRSISFFFPGLKKNTPRCGLCFCGKGPTLATNTRKIQSCTHSATIQKYTRTTSVHRGLSLSKESKIHFQSGADLQFALFCALNDTATMTTKRFAYYLSLICIFCQFFLSIGTTTETLIGVVGKDFVLLGADSSMSQSIIVTANNMDKIAVVADPGPINPHQVSLAHQQTLAVAVAGDPADTSQVVGLLRAYATIEEYEKGVGCDVDFFDSAGVQQNNDSPAGLTVHALACLARQLIYQQLRTRTPLRVGMLVAGMMLPNEDDSVLFSVDDVLGSSISSQVQRQLESATTLVRPADSVESREATKKSAITAVEIQQKTLLQPRLFWLDEYGSMQRMKEYAVHGYASMFLWSILDKHYRPNMSLPEAQELLKMCFQQLRERYVINHSAGLPCVKCIDASGCRML